MPHGGALRRGLQSNAHPTQGTCCSAIGLWTPNSSDESGHRSSTGTATADSTGTQDTDRVSTATATTVERSGPGISTALDKYAPQERPRFEAELRDALARAHDDLDVTRVDEVLSRWHSRAAIVANPLTSEEQAAVRRARAGDLSGLRARDESGGWATV